MTPNRRAVFDVLNSYRKEGEAWCDMEAQANNPVLQFVLDRFQRVLDHDLEQLNGHEAEGDFGSGKAMFLKPSAKEPKSVVLLKCSWKLPKPAKGKKKNTKVKVNEDSAREILRMYIGIFRPNEDPNGHPHFCGLRFETPEGPGKHNYFHVQLIQASSFDDCIGTDCLISVPESYPAMPLHVVDLSELAASVYLALHGLDTFRDLSTPNQSVNKAIKVMRERCDAEIIPQLAG